MKKKASFFLPSLRGGGAEKVFLSLAREFNKRKYDVNLVLAQKEGEYLKFVDDDIKIIDLKASRMLNAIPKIKGYIRKNKPDYFLSTMNYANVAALWAKKLSHVSKTKVIVRDASSMSGRLKWDKKISNYLLWYTIKKTYAHADAIISVSKENAEFLSDSISISREKIKTIYNPIDLQRLTKEAKEEVKENFFNKGKVPFIVSAGRFSKAKSFQTLIKAFAIVSSKVKLNLVILGKGETRSKLEHLIGQNGLRDRVYMPGFVHNPYKYIAKSSLFVLPSLWEGLPNVLLQALALDVPVVSTNCKTGPKEILEGGEWGELVPVRDHERMAEAILKQIDKNNRVSPPPPSFFEDFHITNIADKYQKLMENL